MDLDELERELRRRESGQRRERAVLLAVVAIVLALAALVVMRVRG